MLTFGKLVISILLVFFKMQLITDREKILASAGI